MHDAPVILHGGSKWIVIDKPVGWHTSAGRGDGDAPDVESWLRDHVGACADLDEAGLVHRLDRYTGGCLLVALHEDARRTLRDAVSGRPSTSIVRKFYLAQCRGSVPVSGSFQLYFTSRYKRSKRVTVDRSGPAKALGRCTWEGGYGRALDSGEVVQIELVGPGRRHQIRAGMAYLGWPLVGDTLYGGNDLEDRTTDTYPRLHAWRVEIDGIGVESTHPDWTPLDPGQ